MANTSLRERYITLRKLGLRAITAYGIAKYGFEFLLNLLIDDETDICH